jgi:hypothetical protein
LTLVVAHHDRRFFRPLEPVNLAAAPTSVSERTPARNEQLRIERCMHSVFVSAQLAVRWQADAESIEAAGR